MTNFDKIQCDSDDVSREQLNVITVEYNCINGNKLTACITLCLGYCIAYCL